MYEFSQQRLVLSTGNTPIHSFVTRADGGDLDLAPPYQRGDVWGLRRRQNLVRSIFQNVPIAAIIVNDRFEARFIEPSYDQARNWAYAVVDGKQRITTMLKFRSGEFGVPSAWFTPETATELLYWDDLTPVTQSRFDMRAIPVIDAQLTTLDEERELFNLINFGGLTQDETDSDI